MKRIFPALLLAAFVAAGSMAGAADNGPAEIKLPAKSGTVIFPHLAHQAKVSDCTVCHHKGVEAGACTGCHGVDPAALKVKKAFHDQCRGCHRGKKVSTECKFCHKK